MGVRSYVVQTLPGQDSIARANLVAQGFEGVFQPTRVVERRHPRFLHKTHSIIEPIYGGYVFVDFDASEPHWRSINGTRGVKKVLGETEKPTPVPIEAMAALRSMWAAGAFDPVPDEPLRVDEVLRARSGTFAGQTGRCLEIAAHYIAVCIQAMGGAVKVKFPIANVERA